MLNIHWKDWCWCWSSNIWLPDMKSWPTGKDPDAGKDWGQKKKGATENEMVGWHHQLNGHEFEQTLGDREGLGSLMCCSSWGHSVGHNLATEQLSQEALWGDVFSLIWNKKGYKSKQMKFRETSRNNVFFLLKAGLAYHFHGVLKARSG